MPRGSRSSSRQSSTSSQGSEKDYALAVNLYGRGDPTKRDPPAHWGAMLSRRGEKHGDLYHVRKNEEFFFEDPVLRRPVESNTSYGRSEITYLSRRRKDSAARVLDAYGKKESNLPGVNENCHNWTVGALGALEENSLAPEGTRDYWKGNIGKPSPHIGDRLERDGRSWIPKPIDDSRGRAPADATFGKEQVRQPTGRLNMDRFASLSGLSGSSSKSRR